MTETTSTIVTNDDGDVCPVLLEYWPPSPNGGHIPQGCILDSRGLFFTGCGPHNCTCVSLATDQIKSDTRKTWVRPK